MERARYTHDGNVGRADGLDTTLGYVRAVVWAHNSHFGDACATQMGSWGELNLGQLARERHGDRAFLIGFTTHTETVTAAREWDEPAERRRVVDRFVLATSAAATRSRRRGSNARAITFVRGWRTSSMR